MEFLVVPQMNRSLIECYSADSGCYIECPNLTTCCLGGSSLCPQLNPCSHSPCNRNPCNYSPCQCNEKNLCPIQFTPVCPQNDCNMKVVISSLG